MSKNQNRLDKFVQNNKVWTYDIETVVDYTSTAEFQQQLQWQMQTDITDHKFAARIDIVGKATRNDPLFRNIYQSLAANAFPIRMPEHAAEGFVFSEMHFAAFHRCMKVFVGDTPNWTEDNPHYVELLKNVSIPY